METVRHHGRSTAYSYSDRSNGSGPGCCCIHGSGGSHAVWNGQFQLASRTPVAALDLSGHGESDDIDADAGYETLSAYTDDLEAVVEATDCSVLVGHSLGAAVALWAALERDLDLAGLVLTGAGPRLPVLSDLLEWLADDFEEAVEFLHEPDRLFHDPTPERREASINRLRKTGQAVTVRDFRTANRFNVIGRLDEIELPAAAVVGEYDQLTPLRYHQHFGEELSDCSVLRIQEAAHLAMLEQPQAFNAALSVFLDRIMR
ncbi:alpha/beta fold hydrolase [Halohasta litorea]|uniref:Alpha/beta fold hydrolase n=1 Tax=Halohasta litorea TaxID=869891 RepID=A0ABD6D8C9_9EURY|nr:alpha/beta hydrolase [Halohasta litorea]